MPLEIETKFKVSDPGRMRRNITRIGARLMSRALEQDVYYGKEEKGFGGTVIRLRKINGKRGVFTVKLSVSRKAYGVFKVKEELEVCIEDVKTFGRMLPALGLVPRFVKEKRRESYALGKAKILLDELPFVGWYLEIEGTRKDITRLAKRLGLDIKKGTAETYSAIFNRYRAVKKIKRGDMVFVK